MFNRLAFCFDLILGCFELSHYLIFPVWVFFNALLHLLFLVYCVELGFKHRKGGTQRVDTRSPIHVVGLIHHLSDLALLFQHPDAEDLALTCERAVRLFKDHDLLTLLVEFIFQLKQHILLLFSVVLQALQAVLHLFISFAEECFSPHELFVFLLELLVLDREFRDSLTCVNLAFLSLEQLLLELLDLGIVGLTVLY